MRKKIILFLVIFLFLFALADFGLAKKCTTDEDCQKGVSEAKRTIKCINNKCIRALEITYPKIGDKPVEEIVAKEGLPGYVKYIFTLSVTLIGLVILGALIYNGILYLTSTGYPEKMTESKKGILYAFAGGLILLSAVLIFNTINPQLMIMELPKIEPLEQVVIPGVYICNYKIEKIEEILKKYTEEKGEKQIEAAKELREIMWNEKEKKACPRVNFSGNFQNFGVTKDANTIFIVPSLLYDKEGKRYESYEYGIVLHKKENFGGQCDYYPKEDDDNLIYHQIKGFSAEDLEFTARSVTVFKEPLTELVGDGVTLYSCLNYNREGACNGDPPPEASFAPVGDDIMKVNEEEFEEFKKLKNNTRSISFSPAGSYFALLFEGNEFKERCKLLHKNNPNIMDIPISMCPTGCKIPLIGGWLTKIITGESCVPCLGSMIVIKGSVL